MKFITSYKFNDNYTHLSATVSELGILAFKNHIYPILKEKNKCKSFNNILRLYVFLTWMNHSKFIHVNKEDMAEMIFSKHWDRFEDALAILDKAGYVRNKANRNKVTTRMYYTYETFLPNYKEEYPIKEVRLFEYDIPERTSSRLIRHKWNTTLPITENDITNNQHNTTCQSSHTKTDSPLNKGQADNSFRNMFVQWYDELIIDGFSGMHGKFSNRIGRFCHPFHKMHKEERAKTVLWDNQHVVEAWDAHSAFFIILSYYLLKVKEYNSEEEREVFTKEARCLADFCMTQDLYRHIAGYHNRNASSNDLHYTRDGMKKLVLSYCSRSRKYLFRKDGKLKNAWFCKRYQFIDEYFKEYYPNIRDLLLDYPRHEEIVLEEVDLGGYIIRRLRRKLISNIYRDIMPSEFTVICEGICRILYEKYGIKSITVHDAIYMKQSDADREIDIDAILRQIVLGEQPARKSVNLLEGIF